MLLVQGHKDHGQVLQALNHLIESVWCFDECQAVRIGKWCRSLPDMPSSTHSTLVYWDGNMITEPLIFMTDCPKVSLADIMGTDCDRMSFVQLLHNSDNPAGLRDSIDATADMHGEEDSGQRIIPDNHSDRLSTIPEGSHEDRDSDNQDVENTFRAFLTQFDKPDLQADVEQYQDLWALYQDAVANPCEHQTTADIPMHYVHPDSLDHDSLVPRIPNNPIPLDPDQLYITELLVLPKVSNCFGDSAILSQDEMFSIQMYHTMSKVEVIKRASDILSKEELITHKTEVEAAILEELRIWNNYNCFKMFPRKGARNIIDSRFVAKWKVKDLKRPYESRVIRMRMALRGFKEWCAENLDTYAATGSKVSQRLLLSEAACNPQWSFLSLDINKAFLQGMTYQELSELTGQEERIVHFTPPPGSAPILRLLPEFQDFDERYHVLKCLKPGTGCKDAPRAFSMKLASVTRHAKVGLKPLSADPECEVKHRNGKLVLILVSM